MGEPAQGFDQPVPAPARGQPGGLVAVVRRGLRRGRPARRPRHALGRLRRLPLVPRDGARVVRGPRDGRGAQRARGRGQGGPGGAARRGRGLHDRDPGHDRPGRLADDGVHDAGRRAVLHRHVLSAGLLPAAGAEHLPGLAGPARRRDRPGQARGHRAGRERRRHRGRPARPARRARRGVPAGGRRGGAGPEPGLRRGPRRVRRRAEVPAVDGAGVPAPPPRAHRRA